MGRDSIRLSAVAAGGVQAIAARFHGHAYDLHRHDEWLVGVTDQGVQDFFCRGARRRSTPGRIILIEPQEAHDGQAVAPGGFSYRMLYLPRAWMRQALDSPGGDPGFSATLSDDDALAGAIRAACAALGPDVAALARDDALDGLVARLRPHLHRPAAVAGHAGRDPGVARRARARLHAALSEDIGADALAREAGAADRFALARAFRAAYGTSPHAYLVQLRLRRARLLLGGGGAPASVAAACGFADQSHLGRWFRAAYGLTPGAYRALACTDLPDAAAARGEDAA